jgi:hypothetical protein
VEAGAQVGRETVDVPAQLEQRVVGRLPRECPDGRPDGLGLGPPTLSRPGVEPVEIRVVEKHLQWPGHGYRKYRIMIVMSIRS